MNIEKWLTFGQKFGQKRGNLLYWKKGHNLIQGKEGFHEQVYTAFAVYAGSV
jgi:hypothetical protein